MSSSGLRVADRGRLRSRAGERRDVRAPAPWWLSRSAACRRRSTARCARRPSGARTSCRLFAGCAQTFHGCSVVPLAWVVGTTPNWRDDWVGWSARIHCCARSTAAGVRTSVRVIVAVAPAVAAMVTETAVKVATAKAVAKRCVCAMVVEGWWRSFVERFLLGAKPKLGFFGGHKRTTSYREKSLQRRDRDR